MKRPWLFALGLVSCGVDVASIPAADAPPQRETPPSFEDAAASADAGDAGAEGGAREDAVAPLLHGLDARPANPTCRAFTAPPTTGEVRFVDRFPRVPLVTPTGMFQRPNDDTRWYVTERAGRVVHFPNDPAATSTDVKTALDLRSVTTTSSDCSMSSLAFPKDFATSKRAYVGYCYRGPETENKLQIRISRFATNDGGNTFDAASEQVVLALDFPYDAAHPTVGLHSSDAIRFGKDGYLYAAIGDGGPQGRVGGEQAQDPNDLRGKLLRLDVSDLTKSLPKDFVANRQRLAVDIPPDNPFVGGGGHPAVYAYGFRNPWQWHFDRSTDAIWLGDVGNGTWEEVNRAVREGGNYGWAIFEGFACTGYERAKCTDAATLAAVEKPLLAYRHGTGVQEGKAVTGGLVYRGTGAPSLTGAYVFGDSSTGRIWAVKNVDTLPAGAPAKEPLADGAPVSSFAEDQNGELYATILYGSAPGRILMLEEAAAGPGAGGPPTLLSATGCFEADAKTPKPALVPYSPVAELWSDGAEKSRWLALPEGAQITIGDRGHFELPNGSVLVKEFRLEGKRVETRFFVHQDDGRWAGYSYRWNEAETDATLVPAAGAQATYGAHSWTYPTRAQCFQCHTRVAGTTLGLELAQLDHPITYPATGRTANQLTTLAHVGLAPAPPAGFAGLAAIADTSRSLTDRARSYLHANCSMCHRPEGPTFTPLDLRWQTPLDAMGICNEHPTIDTLDDFIASDPRLLAPGDPRRSVLYWRLATEDARVRMPPIARTRTHAAAATVIGDWITATTACP